jgi:hypothetical protein
VGRVGFGHVHKMFLKFSMCSPYVSNGMYFYSITDSSLEFGGMVSPPLMESSQVKTWVG